MHNRFLFTGTLFLLHRRLGSECDIPDTKVSTQANRKCFHDEFFMTNFAGVAELDWEAWLEMGVSNQPRRRQAISPSSLLNVSLVSAACPETFSG